MFRIADGREHFYQWDLNRQVIVTDPTITEVHFCNKTDDCSLVVAVYADPLDSELKADVPNILLQNDFPIRVYAYCGDGYTKVERVFKVVTRTKPSDYIYTQTEVKTVETIEKRMEELEESFNENIGNIVADYMEEHPVEVDLTGYATEKYVDDAIYNSKDSYYIRLANIPTGEENATTASDELVEFATRFMNDKNVCLHFQDNDGTTNTGYKSASIISVSDKITFKDATIDILRIANNAHTNYFSYTLKLSGTDWVIYKTFIGGFTLTTKEYVDDAIANIDIPEGGGDADNTDTYYFNPTTDLELDTDGTYIIAPELIEFANRFVAGERVFLKIFCDDRFSCWCDGMIYKDSDTRLLIMRGTLSLKDVVSYPGEFNIPSYEFVNDPDFGWYAVKSITYDTNIVTKEYVDSLFEGIAIAEGGSY